MHVDSNLVLLESPTLRLVVSAYLPLCIMQFNAIVSFKNKFYICKKVNLCDEKVKGAT